MASVPQSFRKLVCQQLTNKFAEAVKIETTQVPKLADSEVLVSNRYMGVNASDINFTAGHYTPDVKPPFDIGFEGLGKIVQVGSGVKSVKVGQPVLYASYGAFAEYKVLEEQLVIPVPGLKPEYLPFLVSGLTATLALDKVGEIKSTDTVLVTAAAGGTGQFAVQWAKLRGCRVLGTCSSDEKVEFLKKIGCDRPINYKKENLAEVLQKECPTGVDVVYESVGGTTFETCVKNLAVNGRLVIIGMIETYGKEGGILSGGSAQLLAQVPLLLLKQSASLRGFFLPHYREFFKEYLTKLIFSFEQGKLQSQVDLGSSTGKSFSGVDDVTRAVEFMFSGKNIGKIVVEVPEGGTTKL